MESIKQRKGKNMAIRNIRELGDSSLRKICKPVNEVNHRTKVLIEDMFDTMYEANGVGLAAPQVGILKRIFVIDCGDEEGNSVRRLDAKKAVDVKENMGLELR